MIQAADTRKREGLMGFLEEAELARRWHTQKDPQALGRLIMAHLGLVIQLAMEFRYAGPPMEDLIQEGNLGLTIAARRFDPYRHTRLAACAPYWIRAKMLEFVMRLHGPVSAFKTREGRRVFFQYSRARRRLERDGHDLTIKRLAKEMGVREKEVRTHLVFVMPPDDWPLSARSIQEPVVTTEDELALVMRELLQDGSLSTRGEEIVDRLELSLTTGFLPDIQERTDQPIASLGWLDLEDYWEAPLVLEEIHVQRLVADDRATRDLILYEEQRARLLQNACLAFPRLSPRERRVLRALYFYHKPVTLVTLAGRMRISRWKVTRIRDAALMKLRAILTE